MKILLITQLLHLLWLPRQAIMQLSFLAISEIEVLSFFGSFVWLLFNIWKKNYIHLLAVYCPDRTVTASYRSLMFNSLVQKPLICLFTAVKQE